MPRWMVLGLLAGVLAVGVACSDIDPDTRPYTKSSRENADLSTASVLVPRDERFRKTWEFFVLDSPNNYTYRSNVSVSYDPDVIRELSTGGSLVNDVETWGKGTARGRAEVSLDLQRAARIDSADPVNASACEVVDAELQIAVCEYAVRDNEPDQRLAVRRFEGIDTVMVVVFSDDVGLEYVSGEFDIVPFEEAARRWLVNPL